jgi:hypothetical protein
MSLWIFWIKNDKTNDISHCVTPAILLVIRASSSVWQMRLSFIGLADSLTMLMPRMSRGVEAAGLFVAWDACSCLFRLNK